MSPEDNLQDIDRPHLLRRDRLRDFFTLSGLTRLTGVATNKLGEFIVKEIIDNALDASEDRDSTPTVDVSVEMCDDYQRITISDKGVGFPPEQIMKVIDFKNFVSSRHDVKKPSRGALGYAWKTILGSCFALWEDKSDKPSIAPITITSCGTRHNLYPRWDQVDGPKVDHDPSPDLLFLEGAVISIILPPSQSDWLFNLVKGYSILNPQASFAYHAADSNMHYPSKLQFEEKKYRENIHCYTFQDFSNRLEAEGEYQPDYEAKKFFSNFQFIGNERIDTTAIHLSDIRNNRNEQRKIYNDLKAKCRKPSPATLPMLGKESLLERSRQIYGMAEKQTLFVYDHENAAPDLTIDNDSISVPYILEVTIGAKPDYGREVYIGLNGSLKLDDPFKYVLATIDGSNLIGVEGILDHYKLGIFQPIFVVVNLTCPNPIYTDPGKTKLDIKPFWQSLGNMLMKLTKKYNKLIRNSSKTEKVTQVGESLRVLPDAIKKASSDGAYSFKQRQLWYVVREKLGEICPDYKYFANDILDKARKLGIPGLDKLLKEANSELHEPRGHTSVSLSTEEEECYRIPTYSYNKVLYIEKRGFKDVIVANRFHDRFDIAVIGSQGESSQASRRLLKRIELEAKRRGERITLMCIHDADREGHDIFETLRAGNSGDNIDLIDLGLSLVEAVLMKLQFETVTIKKPISFNKKLIDALTDGELILMTGYTKAALRKTKITETKRVELNAMTPELFLGWLERKIKELGIEEKVRPPKEIVNAASEALIREKLRDILKVEIDR